MKWNHIMDKQPENETVIIQLDMPQDNQYPGEFSKHYTMGMRLYRLYGDWETYMDICKRDNHYPNFWWIYAKDFPFPEPAKDDK